MARHSLGPPRVETSPVARVPSAPTVDPVALTSALQQAFASPSYRPPTLPAVVMEVMPLATRPDAKFGEVVKVLERDPVLAARVLSIAQSAAYATRSKVLSLQQAAVRLGLSTLRDLVVEAALHVKVFRVPGHDDVMARLYRHSTAVAHVMRAVCRRARVEAEYAFLSGLLHDVGITACLLAISERPEWRRVPFDALVPVLDAVHADASGQLARRWKLPEPIAELVADHHALVVNGKPQRTNAALIVAEQLCWEAGAGMLPPPDDADPNSKVTPEPPLEGLDVNWIDLFTQAQQVLGMDEPTLLGAREEAFGIVASL